MNITIPNRNQLREACQGFGKIINGRCTLPVLGCVHFEAGKGGIVAQATDLDQTLEYRFDGAQVHGGGGCIIPFTTLKDLTKGGRDERVEIDAESPLQISVVNHVGGQAVRQPVAGMDLDEWPTMDTDIPAKPAEGFIEAYRRLTPFSSTDTTRHVINSVFVEVGKGVDPVTMVATDGRRLASWNSMSFPLTKSIVVPVTKFLNWAKLPDGVEIGVREDNGLAWLGVKAGPFSYTVKAIDGAYPNFRQVIPAEAGEHVITVADSDVGLLKQVLPTLPGEEDITLLGHDSKVTLYGRGQDDDRWTTLRLENTTYRGDRTFIGLNRFFLLDALEAGFREFSITDELSPLLSRDGNGGTHVLMPIRVQDPEEADKGAKEATSTAHEPEATDTHGAAERTADPAKPAPRQTKRKEKQVTKQNEQKSDTPALDHVLAACDAAKAKVKEAGQALAELAAAIKDAAREQKTQAKEVEQARTALAKLQAISL